jgi:hypothetical protein
MSETSVVQLEPNRTKICGRVNLDATASTFSVSIRFRHTTTFTIDFLVKQPTMHRDGFDEHLQIGRIRFLRRHRRPGL